MARKETWGFAVRPAHRTFWISPLFTRATGWIIVPLWLIAMTWLVAHDVWPNLVAENAPPFKVTDALLEAGRTTQQSIHDDLGVMGYIWTEYILDPNSARRTDEVFLERLPMPITPLRMTIDSVFTAQGVLDEFTVNMVNPDTKLELHGERFHSDFSFRLKWETVEKLYKMPLTDGGLISGMVNPFSQLTGLSVGQRWRMQVFNPLAVITGLGERFMSVLVEVTGTEVLTVDGQSREYFVVESPNAKAWVAADGAVPLQEVKLPLIGKLRITRDAEVDDAKRVAATRGRLNRREKVRP